MEAEEILDFCLGKKDAYIDYPFGCKPICVKVHNKIFAQVYPEVNDFKLTLKCEPMFGDFYRQMYPESVVRGYHCPPVQQPYWNTIYMNRDVSDEEIKIMINHAYKVVVAKLPKAIKKNLFDI